MSGVWEGEALFQVCGRVRSEEGEVPWQACGKVRSHVRCGDEDHHVRCVWGARCHVRYVGRQGAMSGVWEGEAPCQVCGMARHHLAWGKRGAMSGVGMRIAMSGVCVWGEAPCQACGGSKALCQVCGTTRCHVRHEEGEVPRQVCRRTRCHVRYVGRRGATSR